ncbi:type II/IV secretion system ATPase subunit [Haladaptatus sp. DYSN1]|uniref:type II/IV secretion system ATPase subunit n=1 Tax=unclassified Haladaptatus TaxID=2622732 RepID=UPI002406FC61|nr:type II/IV secretion system ATPase subunit [Haladaptatus sp. DYSN1]
MAGQRPTDTDTHDAYEPESSALSQFQNWLSRASKMLSGSSLELENYDPNEDGPLVTYDGLDGWEEIDRYWVNAPFAFVTILFNPAANDHRYHVVEPDLSPVEARLLETLVDDIRDPLLYRKTGEHSPEDVLKDELRKRLEEYGVSVEMTTFYRLFYYLYRSFLGYGKLDPVMHDPHVEDISCDGYDIPLFIYHDQQDNIETSISFQRDELDNFVIQLAQRSGQHISIGSPVVGTTLPDGSRAELVIGQEVTPRGSAFTIRRYAEDPLTPIDLINYGTFTLRQMAYLWLGIESGKSLIFAGGTASGKTTSMNAVSMFIPPRAKVLTIEDTHELALYHENWLSSVTRDRLDAGADITMFDLLRSALRHRPEYIIVGEVRGEEAMTLFQAMNTGHTTYSTMHADSVQTVINRLENEPINVPRQMVQSLDILCIQSLVRIDGERSRRNRTIAEIEGINQRTGELDYSTAYTWNPSTDTVTEGTSTVLDEIRDERGWSQAQLLSELRNRRRFLEHLREQGVSDYRQFTAEVNEYYADKAAVLARIDAEKAPAPSAE